MNGTMRRILHTLLLSVALLFPAAPALADPSQHATVLADNDGPARGRWRERRDERRADDGQQRIVPLETVIGGLMSSYPGKALDARGPMQRGDRLIYEIVWLTENGRQIVIIVDATSGQVVRVHGLN